MRHRHDHLADGLRLCGGAEGDLVQLRHAVDEQGDLRAEVAGEIIEGVVGVFDRVMEQGGDQCGGVHADLGGDVRDRERVGDVRFPRLPEHPVVKFLGGGVGTVEKLDVRLGVIPAVYRDERSQHRIDAALSCEASRDSRGHPQRVLLVTHASPYLSRGVTPPVVRPCVL